MEMNTTQYAKAKAENKPTEPARCSCGDCQGLPVFNKMCVFHSVAQDQYVRGAMTIVLRNHPIYHTLLNYARLCTHYDPPKTTDEWKVIFGCAQLLDRVRLLPQGVDLSDKKMFKSLIDGMHRRNVGGVHFDATYIGMALETYLVDRVLAEAHRFLESTKNIDSLLSTADKAEMDKRSKFRKEDFVEFGKLPMFNPKAEVK